MSRKKHLGIPLQDLGRSSSVEIRRNHNDALTQGLEPTLLVKRMVDCVNGKDSFDQSEIRSELKGRDSKAWKKLLEKLLEDTGFKEAKQESMK